MKLNILILSVTALVCFGATLSSCNKEDDVNVTRALIDDWTPNKFAIDNNYDGILDSNEINQAYRFDEGYDYGTLTFNEDQTGIFMPTTQPYGQFIYTLFGVDQRFNWSTNDVRSEIMVIKNYEKESMTTKIIFQDYNHFAIYEGSGAYLTYGQPVWIFYRRK